jgi:hypothetical protein
VDGSGYVVVTGLQINTNRNFPLDFYTAKLSATNGELLWEQRYNGPADSDDYGTALILDACGNVVVTGGSATRDDYDSADYYTAKYAATNGALLWEKRYNGPADREDFPVGLALGPRGMIAVAGRSKDFGNNLSSATVVYRDNLPALSIELVPAGVRLFLVCGSGSDYQIERAPAIMGPWIAITTLVGGLGEYVDDEAPWRSAFYRIRSQ